MEKLSTENLADDLLINLLIIQLELKRKYPDSEVVNKKVGESITSVKGIIGRD